ncbi:hypothetical protein NKH52_31210 [Mesorhizobium sp. M1066]|uniref:hypothetical protein n=1 Tax=unclassified Mesorhizobium TaxID=325217 RepID=UPI003337DCEF
MSEISDSAGRHGCPEAKATAAVADVRLFCSRMMFVRADPRETQQVVFDAHDRAFTSLGLHPVDADLGSSLGNFVMIWTGKIPPGRPARRLSSSASYAFLTLAKNRQFSCAGA